MGKGSFNRERFPEEEIRAFRKEGKTAKELAEHYKCARSTITAVLRGYDLADRPAPNEQDVNQLLPGEAKDLMERFNQRIRKAVEAEAKREERMIAWQQRKQPKEKKTKVLRPEEVPRGYVW